MGGYEPSVSHPLYGPTERRHTEGAAGVQEAVACRCLITAETARSVAGQYPAGSGVLPASSTTHTQAHPHKPVVSALVWFIFIVVISLCNVNHTKIYVFCKHFFSSCCCYGTEQYLERVFEEISCLKLSLFTGIVLKALSQCSELGCCF